MRPVISVAVGAVVLGVVLVLGIAIAGLAIVLVVSAWFQL